MKLATRSTQKKLFKSIARPIPTFDTFSELLPLHNYTIDKPIIMTCKSSTYRMVLYAMRNRITALTEANYNKLISNKDKLTNALNSIVDKEKFKPRRAYELFREDFGVVTFSSIAEKLRCSPRSVHKWVDSISDKFADYICVEIFGMIRNTPQSYMMSLPISNTTIDRIDAFVCAELKNLPRKTKKQLYPKLFTLAPIKTALGARILLEGGSHEDVYRCRIDFGLDCADDKLQHNYRYTKQAFFRYLKNHSEQMYHNILDEK